MHLSTRMLKAITLPHGSTVFAGVRQATPPSRLWIVHLPESGAGLYRGTLSEAAEFVGTDIARRHNYLVINKTGLGPKGKNPKEFENAFRRERRLADAAHVLATLVPADDKIYLIGYSEGAYLAPQIARSDRRVVGMALIGGGTRGWLKEELNNGRGREREIIRREIDKIRRNPNSTQKWNGFSYATWHSYRGDDTLQSLKDLNVSTLAILGGRDKTIDFETTLADLKTLARRQKIDVRVLPNCGHSFSRHWPTVRKVIREVLEPTLSKSPTDFPTF